MVCGRADVYDSYHRLDYLDFVGRPLGRRCADGQIPSHELLVSLGLEPHLHGAAKIFQGHAPEVALRARWCHDPQVIIPTNLSRGLDALAPSRKVLLHDAFSAVVTGDHGTTALLEVAERIAHSYRRLAQ